MSQTDATGPDTSKQSLAKRCFDYVEDYRCSRISKVEANIVLIEIITAELSNTSTKVSTVAGPYITMLDQVESELVRAANRSSREHRERSVEPAPQHERSPNPENRSRQGSYEPGEPARKRSKLDYSSVAISVKTRQFRPLSANLERTNEILANWSRDQKEVRRYLMYHKYGPEFHESGWAEIVAGKCINLDVVHTIISSSHTIDKQTETLVGDIEVSYRVSEATSKKIATNADWFSAWNKAAEAVKFAFPHREIELNRYFAYISMYFAQSITSAHDRVIRFDKAVRSRVGTSRRLELTDYHEFQDLVFAHFNSEGRQRHDNGDSKSGNSAKDSNTSHKRDPCRKWNSGECTRSASSCRYAHICSFEQDGRVCGRKHVKTKHIEDAKSKST
jgi:hypothetical protein